MTWQQYTVYWCINYSCIPMPMMIDAGATPAGMAAHC
jgi:hypothetical protein